MDTLVNCRKGSRILSRWPIQKWTRSKIWKREWTCWGHRFMRLMKSSHLQTDLHRESQRSHLNLIMRTLNRMMKYTRKRRKCKWRVRNRAIETRTRSHSSLLRASKDCLSCTNTKQSTGLVWVLRPTGSGIRTNPLDIQSSRKTLKSDSSSQWDLDRPCSSNIWRRALSR